MTRNSRTSPNERSVDDFSAPLQLHARALGFSVAGAATLLGFVHVFAPEPWSARIDRITLGLVALAVVPWLVPFVLAFVKSVKIGDTVIEFREEIHELKMKVDVIEKDALLPGRPEVAGKKLRRHVSDPSSVPHGLWALDPNKNQFNGAPSANGRALEAEIKPVAGPRSAACRVSLRVRSTDSSQPLTGKVTLHLHPTFGKYEQYDVAVENGVAEDRITAWGAFTVGVEADDGKTRLELDLADVEGGTRKFYEQ